MTASIEALALRFGTRGSALALAQTRRVIELLQQQRPDVFAEPVVIRTEGDADKTTPLTVLGGRGVFTSALQTALLAGEIDAAVHSAKDLPTDRPAGLELVAFPERGDPRDIVISRHRRPLADLPAHPRIGTSSRRRAVQIMYLRPDARIVDLRGNIDTRLYKALAGDLDAIVLAAAGVQRLGWEERITEFLAVDEFVPSPGQGALAVEARASDPTASRLLALIDDPAVATAVRLERSFLRAVGGGCTKPIAAHVTGAAGGWRLRGMIATDDGGHLAYANEALDPAEPTAHAAAIARQLLSRVSSPTGRFGVRPAVSGLETEPPTTDPGVNEPRGPLTGLRVLVTRPRAQAASLSSALRAQGAEPVEVPTIRIEDAGESASLERALTGLVVGDYDWVVFTSVNAVERVLRRLRDRGQEWPAGRAARVVAVGRATAEALTAAGVGVDLVPDESDAEGVITLLARQRINGRRVLYPKGDQARDVIPAGLRRAGAEVDPIDVYRTVPEHELDPEIRDQIERGAVDVVTFASPSSVRGLTSLLGGAAALAGLEIVCVGPVTAAAVRAQGLPVHAVAGDASAAGIVEALVTWRAASLAAAREPVVAKGAGG